MSDLPAIRCGSQGRPVAPVGTAYGELSYGTAIRTRRYEFEIEARRPSRLIAEAARDPDSDEAAAMGEPPRSGRAVRPDPRFRERAQYGGVSVKTVPQPAAKPIPNWLVQTTARVLPPATVVPAIVVPAIVRSLRGSAPSLPPLKA